MSTRTLTTATQAASESKYSDAAFLLEIHFSTVLRLSSRGTQSWGGYTWTGGRIIKVGGLKWDGKGKHSGFVDLLDVDMPYTALILNEGVAGRLVRAWQFYGDNPALADPVEVFYGEGDEADMSNPAFAHITLVGKTPDSSPRRVIGPATGLNHVTVAGTSLTWGGQTIKLGSAS